MAAPILRSLPELREFFRSKLRAFRVTTAEQLARRRARGRELLTN